MRRIQGITMRRVLIYQRAATMRAMEIIANGSSISCINAGRYHHGIRSVCQIKASSPTGAIWKNIREQQPQHSTQSITANYNTAGVLFSTYYPSNIFLSPTCLIKNDNRISNNIAKALARRSVHLCYVFSSSPPERWDGGSSIQYNNHSPRLHPF